MKTDSLNSSSIRRVAIASFIGTTIEWYDFFLYTYATAIVFAPLFFPDMEKGLLFAFGANATGFLARPLGALVCGHFGDRIGRKSMLVFTLMIIGISTFLIGCLPAYETIGIWAPILLVFLRLAQGFAIGGEWGGAVLMTVEHSSAKAETMKKRGFFGSYPQMGVPVGMFLATAVFIALSGSYKDVLVKEGWWRVGFLLSLVLLFIGLYIRLKINESPLFQELEDSDTKSKAPILEVFSKHWKNIFLAAGAKLVENAAFYIYTAFLLVLNNNYQLYDKMTVLTAIALASLLELFTIPAFGRISDLVGRKKVYIIGTIFTGLFAYPFFHLFQTGEAYLMILAVIIALSVGHAVMYGPQASFFSELFDTKVRYSGASMGYQIAAVFGGGIFPLLAVYFLTETKSTATIVLIIIGMALISTISVLLTAETFRKDIGSGSNEPFQESIDSESAKTYQKKADSESDKTSRRDAGSEPEILAAG